MQNPLLDTIYPSVPALVSRDPYGCITIEDLARGSTLRAEGALADAIARVLSGGPVDGALAALPDDHPLHTTLATLAGTTPVPLTSASAIALDGLDTLFLELLGRCNERCLHCYSDSGPHVSSALDEESCRAILRDARELGFARVQFTGGDPLLCRFLPELVAFAAQLGFPQREIYTNGLLLSDRLLDALSPSSPSFALSFYAQDPAIHDAITRTPGSCALTLAAIDRLVARQMPVRVSIVVMPENAGVVDATVDLLKARGVSNVGVAASRSVGRGGAFDFDPSRYDQPLATHNGGSLRGEGRLCVASDGHVYPCIFNRATPLGDVRQRGLRAIARDPRPPRSLLPRYDIGDATALQCQSCRLTARALEVSAGSKEDE